MALIRSFLTVGGWTMASRVLGFLRDMAIAALIGAGTVADAFFVAFQFPNFFRRLFAEGAFNAAFVPLFAGTLERDGKPKAMGFAAAALSVMLAVLLAFTVAAEIAMPWVLAAVAPGFRDEPAKFALAVDFARLTFPYLLFMSVVALLGGLLNSTRRFAATAAAPIMLNLVLLSALALIHTGVLAHPGYALSWGVAAAGIGQFLWIALACRRAGLLPPLPRPRLTPGVRRLFRLMLPGIVGAGVYQINVVVGVVLASLLAEGSVAYLYYADRVNQLPLGVIGVAVGIALLPQLTRQLRADDQAGAADSQNRSIEFALLLTLPAAAALIAIPGPVIATLFERGRFGPEETAATAAALAAFALGLPAYVLIKTLSPGFYAREDTATPVKIAAVAMACNVGLAAALMQVLAHVGIALATACTAWLNAGLLAWALGRRGGLALDRRLRRVVPRVALASALMGLGLLGAAWALAGWLAEPGAARVAALAALVVGGLVVFGLLAQATGAASLREVRLMLRRPERTAA
jgi:putative peptidoglycan lipid II flippase